MPLAKTTSKPPIASLRRTKIIATLGPATDSYQAILGLITHGTNGIRLDFSHGTHEERSRQIPWIRKAAKEAGTAVAIIQDLEGPNLRLGDFAGSLQLTSGQTIRFAYHSDYQATGCLPTGYDLSSKVKRGESIYLSDGQVRATVTSVKDGVVHARLESDGTIVKGDSINMPDTDFGSDVLTAKDRADLIYGSAQDIDYVACHCIRTTDDIDNLRSLLRGMNSSAKIIANIETRAAVANIEAIVQEADAIMVVPSVLAAETAAEQLPMLVRLIIGLGQRYAKPTIMATQLAVASSAIPGSTRAAAFDIATTVLVGADCLLVGDETANGSQPLGTIKTIARLISYSESHSPCTLQFPDYEAGTSQAIISKTIISLAESIAATAIVAETKSGATALQIAARRPSIPVIAVSSAVRTAQQLALVYGLVSYTRPVSSGSSTKLTDWLLSHTGLGAGATIVTAAGHYPGVVGATDTIKVRVLQ